MKTTVRMLVAVQIMAGLLVADASAWPEDEWKTAMRTKGWVTVFRTSEPRGSNGPGADLIVAFAGGETRVIYRTDGNVRQIGWPIVSPDGTHVAFAKSDGSRHQIFVMGVDGSNVRPVFEMPLPYLNTRALTGSPVAWTHDSRAVAVLARREGDVGPAERRPGGPPKSLWRVDVVTGEAVKLRELEFRDVGNWIAGADITGQAWAPDGRRLVYQTAGFRVVILDTTTGGEIDLGAGFDPTWSPDGRFIAFRLPSSGRDQPGDYVVVDADAAPPHRRTLLLANRRGWLGGIGYAGDPLWMPDSRHLIVYHHRGDPLIVPRAIQPHLVDRLTGEVARLPFRFATYAWGGRP